MVIMASKAMLTPSPILVSFFSSFSILVSLLEKREAEPLFSSAS